MEKYGFVYIWYDRKHKRFYIGSHWGTEDDGYICSSFWMKQAYKNRPEDFRRKILKTNITKSNLNEYEHYWLQQIHEDELGKRYYNLRNHRFGHWSTDENKSKTIGDKLKSSWTEEKKQIAREKKVKWIEDHPEKHLEMSKKAGKSNVGKTRTEEWKTNQSERLRKQWASGKRKPHINIRGPRQPRKKVVCPYCQRNGDISIMSRWHFENCKKGKGLV